MIIQILGVDPNNKGSMLMLEAICSQLRGAFPDARIAVPITIPAELRLNYGLWSALPTSFRCLDLAQVSGFLPLRARSALGLVAESELDVVLDASGFAYGDFWQALKLNRRLIRPLPRWRRRETTVVLLPQAFGPFTTAKIRRSMRMVIDGADLIYARDRE